MTLINNKKAALVYVSTCSETRYLLRNIVRRLRKDREIVITAISRDGNSLYDVEPPLCYNMEIILLAIKSCRNAVGAIPLDIPQSDLITILHTVMDLNEYQCIPHGGCTCGIESSYWWVASCYKNTREIIQRISPHCGRAIQHTSFTDDVEIVTTAMTHDIRAYQYISPRLKATPQIVWMAVNSTMPWALPKLLHYIPQNLLQDTIMEDLIRSLSELNIYKTALADEFTDPVYIAKLNRVSTLYNLLTIPHIIRADICLLLLQRAMLEHPRSRWDD